MPKVMGYHVYNKLSSVAVLQTSLNTLLHLHYPLSDLPLHKEDKVTGLKHPPKEQGCVSQWSFTVHIPLDTALNVNV